MTVEDSDADGWESAQEGAELIGEGNAEEAVGVLAALIEREPNNEYAYPDHRWRQDHENRGKAESSKIRVRSHRFVHVRRAGLGHHQDA
jgi:hypothetical protein